MDQLLFRSVSEHLYFIFVSRVNIKEVNFGLEHRPFHHLSAIKEPIQFILPVDCVLRVDCFVLSGLWCQVETDTSDAEVINYLRRALDNGIAPQRSHVYLQLFYLIFVNVGSIEEAISASQMLLDLPPRRVDGATSVAIEDNVHISDVISVLTRSVISGFSVIIQTSAHAKGKSLSLLVSVILGYS